MARYITTIESARPREELFAYLSDFSTAREWDPGVIEAARLGDGEVGEGTEFRLVAEFMGRHIPLTYRVVAFDPPRLVTFRGENANVVSLDTITFEERDGTGTCVKYDADLALKRGLKLADPLLRIVFRRTGDRARAGLREALGALP